MASADSRSEICLNHPLFLRRSPAFLCLYAASPPRMAPFAPLKRLLFSRMFRAVYPFHAVFPPARAVSPPFFRNFLCETCNSFRSPLYYLQAALAEEPAAGPEISLKGGPACGHYGRYRAPAGRHQRDRPQGPQRGCRRERNNPKSRPGGGGGAGLQPRLPDGEQKAALRLCGEHGL